jgi:hypothetical protein
LIDEPFVGLDPPVRAITGHGPRPVDLSCVRWRPPRRIGWPLAVARELEEAPDAGEDGAAIATLLLVAGHHLQLVGFEL